MSSKDNSPHATAAAVGNHNQNDVATHSTASPSPPTVASKVVPPTRPRSVLLHPRAAAGTAPSAATDPYDISSSSPPRDSREQLRGTKSYVVGSEEHRAMLANDIVYSSMKAHYEAKGKAAQARASSVTAAPQGHKERNSKEWSLDQTIALLTEVVEGETYIMVKNKKCEERTLVSRAKGIPHGKTNAFWDAIIEKLQSKHYFVVVEGKSQPLFSLCRKDGTPLSLKKDYVSGHFDKLVNKRLDQKERRRSSAGSRSFGLNGDDFETGDGDDSEHEGEEKSKMNGSAAESDDRLKSNKAKQSHIDELLDAYLIQQRAHKAEVEAASLFVQEDTEQPKAGSKRLSGQEHEHDDDALIEDKSNGKGKKKKEREEKLSKLPMPTHVERSQAASLDHANSMSSGFHALAESQKPSTVEDFKQKSAALVDQIGKTVAETATQAINAWSKYKNSARACVSEEGFHDWLTLRDEPLRMVCKRCGNVIG
jgi:hypothetical protein